MNETIQEIKNRTQAMWLDRPEDVSRMVGRNYETGKAFSCWAYCWGYLSNLCNELYMIFNFAKTGQGDLETHKLLLATRSRNYAGSFIACGHMRDCADTLKLAADAFDKVEDHAQLATLCRTLQRYLLQLSWWVDMELPWAEVSEFVDKRWHEEARAIVE